jgi:hypothetical protein
MSSHKHGRQALEHERQRRRKARRPHQQHMSEQRLGSGVER